MMMRRRRRRRRIVCNVTALNFSFASTTQKNTAAAVSAISRKVLPNEGFWEKNDRMQRPLSPHITIYKYEFLLDIQYLHYLCHSLFAILFIFLRPITQAVTSCFL